jgi:mannose PTS system EIIA component
MEKLPKGIILAAHKPIASAMLKAATQIMGPIDHCAGIDVLDGQRTAERRPFI